MAITLYQWTQKTRSLDTIEILDACVWTTHIGKVVEL